jgi:hypothetical protein
MKIAGAEWTQAGRWWGTGLDGKPMEIDVVASTSDGGSLLIAEAEWSDRSQPERLLGELERKASSFPLAKGREVTTAVFLKKMPARRGDPRALGPRQVLEALP